MISAVIASYNEPKTIGRAIESLAVQLSSKDEIIVTAPDKETRESARRANMHGVPLIIIKDKGEGKPSALNEAIKLANNNFLLLTDGDVYANLESVEFLFASMKNKKVGISTGRVVSSSPRNTCLGFWAYALTESFHELRLQKYVRGKIIATGYLYLIRKNLMPFLPKETLADDAYVSHHVIGRGYSILYEPRAEVYVKYPSTLPDWLRQKKRTAGRVYQLSRRFGLSKMNSFFQEISAGAVMFHRVNSLKEMFWLFGLFVFKLYVWSRVFFDYRLWNRAFSKVWERVESTK